MNYIVLINKHNQHIFSADQWKALLMGKCKQNFCRLKIFNLSTFMENGISKTKFLDQYHIF